MPPRSNSLLRVAHRQRHSRSRTHNAPPTTRHVTLTLPARASGMFSRSTPLRRHSTASGARFTAISAHSDAAAPLPRRCRAARARLHSHFDSLHRERFRSARRRTPTSEPSGTRGGRRPTLGHPCARSARREHAGRTRPHRGEGQPKSPTNQLNPRTRSTSERRARYRRTRSATLARTLRAIPRLRARLD
jgi:hypothetical protein